eukprot:TRINITY_DN9607_c1_g3_i1.p1 TRINITY_DN9607_c1_g3~~TRINITY_DN9607_c1_g3_i1.p1  ORF type:complete len:369 (+),score=21.05 TRINITY_DN9607_c1_g3_i1:184-1290(+)
MQALFASTLLGMILSVERMNAITCSREHGQIGIVVMIKSKSENQYSANLANIKCYADSHNYTFRLVTREIEPPECAGYNAFWARHCYVEQVMDEADWWLVLDADIAFVQDKCLEDYIDQVPATTSIILQQRYHLNSVCALYFIKSSRVGHRFLTLWLAYNKSTGVDNIALWHHLATLASYRNRTLYASTKNSVTWKVLSAVHGYVSPDVVMLPSFQGFLRDASLTDPRVWLQHGQGSAVVKAGFGADHKQFLLSTDFILHGIKATRARPLLDRQGKWPGMICKQNEYHLEIPSSWARPSYKQTVAVLEIARNTDQARYKHVATAWQDMPHSQCWPKCAANMFPIHTRNSSGIYVAGMAVQNEIPAIDN